MPPRSRFSSHLRKAVLESSWTFAEDHLQRVLKPRLYLLLLRLVVIGRRGLYVLFVIFAFVKFPCTRVTRVCVCVCVFRNCDVWEVALRPFYNTLDADRAN